MRRIVVAAHPDDECLWMSSALAGAANIVLCYGAPFGRPEKAAARARAMASLPLANVSNLAIPESGVRKLVDWANPVLTASGMAIGEAAGQARYEANFATLLTGLRPLLSGADEVVTHNGWGEYGHPEHVQVHRAVSALQAELGFTLWSSNYVAPLSLGLARHLGARPGWAEKRVAAPDVALAKRLRGHFLRHGVWTWSRFHRWPAQEVFYARPAGAALAHRLRGESLLDATALRWWRLPGAAHITL